jgi:hypothetical protein
MLVNLAAVVAQLDKELVELATGTMLHPPADYAAFMQVVGRYQEKIDLKNKLREMSRNKDDET